MQTREHARTHTVVHTSAENHPYPSVFLLELSCARKKARRRTPQYRMATVARARGQYQRCSWMHMLSFRYKKGNKIVDLAVDPALEEATSFLGYHISTDDDDDDDDESFVVRWQTETIPIWRRVTARSLRVSWVNFRLVSAARAASERRFPPFLAGSRAPFQTTCSYPTRISGVATVDEE